MTRIVTMILALALLSACGSTGNDGENPIDNPDGQTDDDTDSGSDDGTDGGTDDGTPIDSDRDLPPGTASPTRDEGIFRREAFDSDAGTGFAREIAYDSEDDTFRVSGLGFDGTQPDGEPFTRATPGSLSAGGRSFAVYEAPLSDTDPVDDAPIAQFEHRAIYGVSDSGDTEFAIVRTGAYADYGFGGFVYQRNNGVEIPTSGQASYSGLYGGLRDFDGEGGLEYVRGSMDVQIDFNGFEGNCEGTNCGASIRGFVRNRAISAPDGSDLTGEVLDAINDENGTSLTQMPTLTFKVGPGVLDENGEMLGEVFSQVAQGQTFESGNYYAIMSGDHTSAPGGEIVGVMVLEADDPRFDGVTVRETGGFIVDR